jgi:superfamily II DNA or RNA helicase
MPFNTLRFRYPWRPYQERVLNAIHEHLDDKRLHIVAAPGAGKTTLGLEIFRILEKPALALSPTRIIRDQWIDRLKDFCEVDEPSTLEWVSNSSHEPKLFTSITYQALHAQFSDELARSEEEEETLEDDKSLDENELNSFIKLIEQHQIGVLILDEAHHLRSEWWKALDKVCAHFPEMILVSLTATPPYDSTGNEWMRYEQLCGPIDEEISVPELVKAKTLCAHQDLVWACDATADEKKQIKEHDDRVSVSLNTLFENDEFESIVLSHPWLQKTGMEADIIKQPEIAISILSFLQAKSLPINSPLMSLLDLSREDIPELGRKWWQVLIETILFSSTTCHNEEQSKFVDALKKQLKASELLIKRDLCLVRSRRTERYLSLSSSKIDACSTLHRLEHKQRGDALRQVVLTDYIRDEALISELNTGKLNLGAWPIFRSITTNSPIREEVALLTGRLSILHVAKLETLFGLADETKLKTEAIPGTDQYIKIKGPTNQLTNAFTALLANGHIKTLVGTRSLLGEGWDAPVVNSLVMASSVGSFMLTNQMRGRAIRTDAQAPNKISTIWHLVAINSESYSGWSDLNNLRKRFDIFVGLSEKDLTIESGFERLNSNALDLKRFGNSQGLSVVSRNNREMSNRLTELDQIKERWEKALILDHTARVIPSVRIDKTPDLRSLILTHSFSYLLTQLGFALFTATLIYLQAHARTGGERPLLLLSLAIGGALLYKLPKTLSTIKIVFRHLPVDGSLKQIGCALTEALCRTGLIETSVRNMKINVAKNGEGKFLVSLKGSTFYESSLFSDCLAEILAPIENPRYIVLREGKFLGTRRDDYHAVPMKLAAKKEYAQIFYKAWCKHVSLSELIYTRTPDGRKRLLKAKMKSFSSNFSNQVKRQDRWQ